MKAALTLLFVLLIPLLTPHKEPVYQRILFIGNSLTIAHPAPELGWAWMWGMAASQADKDFIHQMQLALAAQQGNVPEIGIISADLHRWSSVTPDIMFRGQTVQEFAPDLVIVQMGEHATANTPYADYLTAYSQIVSWAPDARFIAVGIWGGPLDDVRGQNVKQVAAATGMQYVKIRDLHTPENEATQYDDRGVAWHPNDAGHYLIAERILHALQFALWLPLVQQESAIGGTIPLP
jgi:hypothetical protein